MRTFLAAALSLLALVVPACGQFLIDPYRFGPAAGLSTGLYAYWKFEESNASRADSSGNGRTIVQTGNIPSSTGKILQSALWSSNTNTLGGGVGVTNLLNLGNTDWTIAGWVKLTNTNIHRYMFGKWLDTPGNLAFLFFYRNTNNRFEWYLSSDGTASTSLVANNFGPPDKDVWYHFAVGHDAAADQSFIAINGGTANTTSFTGGVNANSTAVFAFGGAYYGAPDSLGAGEGPSMNEGAFDEVGVWTRKLSSAEITLLYNSGVGRTCCPF